jgi:tetratricopeptide (TPR) repeat protein
VPDTVPDLAKQLHEQGRAAGARGHYDEAIALLGQAHAAAPDWPYPVYDMAFTYLLQDRTADAAELYAEVDRLAPRGFYTCKTSLHTLRRELAGELPPGFSRSFATLEWMRDPAQKRAVLTGITETFPSYGPAWKELASVLTDRDERLRAIERGLTTNLDADTKGMLILNKAGLLAARGDTTEAIALLRDLAADPQATVGAVPLAKALLTQLAPELSGSTSAFPRHPAERLRHFTERSPALRDPGGSSHEPHQSHWGAL